MIINHIHEKHKKSVKNTLNNLDSVEITLIFVLKLHFKNYGKRKKILL